MTFEVDAGPVSFLGRQFIVTTMTERIEQRSRSHVGTSNTQAYDCTYLITQCGRRFIDLIDTAVIDCSVQQSLWVLDETSIEWKFMDWGSITTVEDFEVSDYLLSCKLKPMMDVSGPSQIKEIDGIGWGVAEHFDLFPLKR